MLAVGFGETATDQRMSLVDEGYLTIACVNSPQSLTVSGNEGAVSHLKNLMDESGVFLQSKTQSGLGLPFWSHQESRI